VLLYWGSHTPRHMALILEITEFEILCDDSGNYAVIEALIDDMVQVVPASIYNPPVFQAAVCATKVLLSDDDDLSAYEHDEEVMELAEDVADADWEVQDYDPTDTEMLSAYGTKWHDGL